MVIEECYSMNKITEKMTETITIEKPKNPETIHSNMVCQ